MNMRHWWYIGLGLAFACAFVLIGSGGVPRLDAAPAGPDLVRGAPPKPGDPPPDAQDGIPIPHVAPLRQGGPDAFGYVYDDSTDPGGPNFSWIAASQIITDITNGDDLTETVALPFAVNFYGVTYNNIIVSDNGNLHFADGGRDYANYCLPNPTYTNPLGIIAPFWDDLDLSPAGHGDLYMDVVGAAPNRIFVVEWRNVAFYGDNTVSLTFEALIYESSGAPNEIRFQYNTLSGTGANGSSATVGIQSYDRTAGLSYSCFADAVQQNLAVRFRVPQAVLIYPPGTLSGGAADGNTVTYTGRILNQTGITNSFGLSLSGLQWPTTLTPTQTSLIGNATNTPFTITVAIPACQPFGSVDVGQLLVRSDLPSPGTYTATRQISTTVNTTGGDFNPNARTQSAGPGTTAIYTTTLTNRSGSTTRYLLSPAGNVYTTTIVPNDTGALATGASLPVTVSVQIPSNAQLGFTDVVTVTARQEPPPTCPYYAQAVFTTTLGSWLQRANPSYTRQRHALVSFPPTGQVYALGGETTGNNRNLPTEAFDPVTNHWTQHLPLRAPVSNIGAAALGNDIYVPGGFDGNGATTWLQVYHPLSDTMEVIYSDPLPQPRYGHGVAALGGKLYVVGGNNGISATRTLYEYDPARPAFSRWQRKTDMLTARVYLGAAALNGKLYAVGGIPGAPTDLAIVEAYDPASDTWTARQPMTVPRGGLALVGVDTGQPCGGYLYALGGGWITYRATVERYNPLTNSWTMLSSLTQARRSLAAAFSLNGGQIVAHGGWNDFYSLTTEALGCGGGAVPSPTPTPLGGVPTATPIPIHTPTPGPCALPFTDVQPTDYFYVPVQWLYCRGVISGYADNTFRPYANSTRAQLAKMVALGYGWDLSNPGAQQFTDVPPSYPFYVFVNVAAMRGIISGYTCGGPGEPCDPQQRPYFRPGNSITRGQLSKIIVGAAGWPLLLPPAPTFSDVDATNPFYAFIETAYYHRIISGYADGTFRWGADATRGQLSKILYSAITFPVRR